MSTAQRLREAAVSFPFQESDAIGMYILYAHIGINESLDLFENDNHKRTFLLIVACSLDGGDV